MWQNDKICFLKIFTWHPKKDQNFNCAFEDDKWRVFPNTFNPFISSDWQIEFCELHSFWIVALKKVTLLSPCILCFEIWNEKVYNKHFRYRFNQLKTVLSKLDLFFLIKLYDICVQILIFWIVFHRVVGYRLCI